MRALVIERPFKASIRDTKDPEPRRGEVVIQVKASGICGTDLHIYRGEEPRARYPLIPGHEISGVVVEVGEGVSGVSEGDVVAVDPNIYCGECYYCRRGLVHFCLNWEGVGVTRPGGLAEKVAVPARNVYRIPGDVSPELAALAEPLSCVLHGVDVVEPYDTSSVAIFGAGPIGLMFLVLLRKLTSARIAVFEISRVRSEKAEELGADLVANPLEREVGDTAKELGSERGFDVIIDATGSIDALSRILRLDIVAPAGKILLFGVAPPGKKIELEPYLIYRKEIRIMGSYVNPFTMWRAVNMLRSVRELEKIINKVSLEEALEIIRGESKREYVKPVVVF